MAQVKLKIEVNPNAETEKIGDITNKVNDVGSKSNLSNVSIKAKDNGMFIVKEMNNNGRELLSFGESGSIKFTQDGYLTSNGVTKGELASEQNPDMFVWGVVPSNKQYSVKLTFINAQNLKDIVVYGDKVSNQFPIEAIIDNKKVIYSDDYRWAINLGTESDTHTIEFTKWNRGDYNACLTLIRVMLRYFEISNSSGLIELESLSQSNSQPKEIYYGLIPNTGSASVNDNYGEINDLINEEIITNSMNNIEIYIDNQKIQHHITTDSDYEDGKVFTMELENSLSFLETKYAGRNLTDSMSAYALLSEVLKTLNYTNEQIDFMLNEDIIYGYGETGSVKSYLEKITIEYPYLESSTYRETLNKFCTLAQLNLMEDDNGNLKFVSARPIDIDSKPVIVIPTNRQFSRLVKDEFLKNKYSNPFVQYCKYIGGENSFGETITVALKEDSGETYLKEHELSGRPPYVYSKYNEIYDTVKNPLKNQTEKVQISNFNYYKVSVKFPISNENIVKDLENLKVSLVGEKAGSNTHIFETFSEDYYPYKTTNFSTTIRINNNEEPLDFMVGIHLDNVEKTTKYIYFDIFFWDVPFDIADYATPYILNATFQLYGTSYNYQFVANEGDFDVEISGNELIQEGTLYNNKKMYELIRDNIVYDYEKGIRTSNITVACLDYYDTKGNKVIDWSKQEILKVGQIVRIDKDNLGNSKVNYIDGEPYLWKITGRRFRYKGVPMVDLELQEVKLIETYEDIDKYYINATVGAGATLIIERISSNIPTATLGKISVNEPLFYGDVINISWTLDSAYTTDTAYLNGEKIYSSEQNQITIDSNVTIEINTKTIGYQEIWSGEYSYKFSDLTTNEMLVNLPTTINTKYGLRLTFSEIQLYEVSSGNGSDIKRDITRDIPFTLSSEFGSHWDSNPIITFEYKQIEVETTNMLKTTRIIGSYNGVQYNVGSFKLSKIEQYIG